MGCAAPDQRKAADAKVEKTVASLDAKVNAKVMRDAARKDAADVVEVVSTVKAKPRAKVSTK